MTFPTTLHDSLRTFSTSAAEKQAQHLAFVVDSPPEVLLLAIDPGVGKGPFRVDRLNLSAPLS